MLRALDIRDMLIIDRLELGFRPGLNVLTGETGAGKSILLDCLGFVLGWRGRADLVRAGAERGEVVAEFELGADHPARGVLAEAGLPDDADELILRRVNGADGRKTAWINDRRVSGEVLRALSATLVELHGQHDDRGLLDPRGHRDMLDIFGGLEEQRNALRAAWRARSAAQKALETAEAGLAQIRAEEDFLRHAAARAAQALGLEGAEGAAGDALRWLEGAVDKAEGRLDGALAALSRALVELDEAGREVAQALEALDFDPLELERCEERLFAIRALARKHGVLPDDLAGFADTLRARLAALDAGAADLAELRRARDAAAAQYDAEARALSAARREAAGRLDAAVMAELSPLRMERAIFTTEIAEAEPGPQGRDAVGFTVATNPGAPSGPLSRIASGGELSRFLLALKLCLAGPEAGLTMIFDEIDRGVGGATADAVGRRLERLAAGGQVLVVTHSPQVAARGAHHWRVEKRVEGEATLSSVRPLGGPERVDEIARMLSGERITPEARAAAEALLAG
jgi:DNA repair protein RecN (Recombination protein N)